MPVSMSQVLMSQVSCRSSIQSSQHINAALADFNLAPT
jgi:hypothetical protein